MKKLLIAILLTRSFSAFATELPVNFDFPYFNVLYKNCTSRFLCSRELVKSFLNKFNATSTERLQQVEELTPTLLSKFEAVEKDYKDAYEFAGIHPKSKKILTLLLSTEPRCVGARLKETFNSLNQAQEKYLELQDKTSDTINVLLQAVIDLEEKPSRIEDQEVRRLYIEQKNIEIHKITNQLRLRLDDIKMYGYDFVVNLYAVEKRYSDKSLYLDQIQDKSCIQIPSLPGSFLVSLPLDGRTDHRKVIQMIVGNGAQAPVKVVCKKVRSLPAKVVFNSSTRVLTIPYTKERNIWYRQWEFTLPPSEQILPIIPE